MICSVTQNKTSRLASHHICCVNNRYEGQSFRAAEHRRASLRKNPLMSQVLETSCRFQVKCNQCVVFALSLCILRWSGTWTAFWSCCPSVYTYGTNPCNAGKTVNNSSTRWAWARRITWLSAYTARILVVGTKWFTFVVLSSFPHAMLLWLTPRPATTKRRDIYHAYTRYRIFSMDCSRKPSGSDFRDECLHPCGPSSSTALHKNSSNSQVEASFRIPKPKTRISYSWTPVQYFCNANFLNQLSHPLVLSNKPKFTFRTHGMLKPLSHQVKPFARDLLWFSIIVQVHTPCFGIHLFRCVWHLCMSNQNW